jgi:DNA-binding NarL/FixJ family response regulator
MPLAVLIVDDHRAVADAVAGRLEVEPEFASVKTAYSFTAAMAAISWQPFDVIVTDIEIGVDDGVELIRRVNEEYTNTATVVLTVHGDAVTAFQALRAGARAFVPKDADASELIGAIRGAVRGETYIPPGLLTGVIDAFRNPISHRTEQEERVERLTSREREVLRRLVAGQDRSLIAAELFLSLDTVRTHIKNILGKLGVHSTLEAVGVALRAGVHPDLLPPRR